MAINPKAEQQRDVCILGGGMAGLTLARQLKRQQPELDITVVEHQQFPVADATHKVGESTVEIASHYLANELGMADHLADSQLPKFGLRLFFRGDKPVADDLSRYDEVGGSQSLPIDTFQLDRGRFENHLAQTTKDDGTELLDGSTIRKVDLQAGQHRVTVRNDGTEQVLRSRYLIDASGRRAWVRKGEELSRPARHNNHALWFRIDARLEIDEWSADTAWTERCPGAPRRLSTNHFTGPGYWLWLIPLSSGATSVGLVFDPKVLDPANVRQHAECMRWLATEHPLVAQQLQDYVPLDFHYMENYAVTSKQVFSDAGWMTTGDAGIFSDPLYSPGGDFIALANGYITKLVTSGSTDPMLFKESQNYFFSFFTNTLSLYRGQYRGFGNCDFMVIKTLWDFAYYWAVMSKLYFSGRFTDFDFMRDLRPQLLQAAALNSGMQRRFREIARSGQRQGGEGRFYDYWAIPWFHELKKDLVDGDPLQTGGQLLNNIEQLTRVAGSINKLLEDQAARRRLAPLDQLGAFA